ncbi:triacylglycerol lipase [Aeromicrobium panaciterrae]|uniref:Triacylglycerol lipase n=1 Tax=Aeromicrobium panaciterrae TaxID=363861 RepID=A0ABU1UKD1_9ACTN|nr:alpha/beta hydrolase fold domain-containing protein [Aeromicrobium panaciterrae]MDR7085620.1 triacylglycerol lipase [Aeromicrobium panaciterrae]
MFWTQLRRRLMIWRRPSSTVRMLLPGRGPMRVVYDKAVVHESYSFRARVLQRAARLVFKPLLRFTPLNDRSLATIRAVDKLSARRPRSPYVESIKFELGGVPVESMVHRFGSTSDMTILYLHGGGFFSGSIETHRRICERLARKTGATVISVDYIQLPEGSIADSVQDVITAYEALLEQSVHPDKVVVAGDSAGGYLTMKVAELANRRGLQAPAALLCFSPLLSIDPDREDKAVQRITRQRDAYLPVQRIAQIRERWLPEEGSAIEGYASPLHAAAYITSPTFLVAVEDEMLRPEVEAMALLLHERGVEVETHLWRKQVHAFPVLAKVLPESEMALQLAADFASRAVGELDRPPFVDPDTHDEVIVGELLPDDAA